ncbi:hypothetical protein LIER_07608 [Lithospermum erythrorhizon]|uniref:Kinesin motor domain-containing protein n=1 Tax=Lithospermum erythrorhizon TaxID=34254 RepID=A0AAV3PD43_LITER
MVRRNKSSEEIENVPETPRYSSVSRDPTRPPLNAIQHSSMPKAQLRTPDATRKPLNSAIRTRTPKAPIAFPLQEDPSFWTEHNVQVLIRLRPLDKTNNSYCLKQDSAQCITWIGPPQTRFTFDHVASESTDQETLFKLVGLPMVENCLSGYNSSVFAYGQTGSGKTFTMLGDIEGLGKHPSPNRGLTPRIFEFLLARIRAEEQSRRDEKLQYQCKCSFLEIYNEQICDLLDPSSTNLQLREDSKKGVYVENLSEFEVQTVGDMLNLLSQGSANRKVAATSMNRESSRSHSVFTCVIESKWEKDSTSNFRFARLNLVDLAGSERQKTSGAEGERLKEAASINKSLSTLGHVIMVLVDVAHGRQRHVPYRDSRLTFLLQDSLGGNSKTTIIANVTPSICCAAETLNTLKFAQRAKLIQNNAIVNEDTSGDVTVLQQQIRVLKEELDALKLQKVSRALTFGSETTRDMREDEVRMDQHDNVLLHEYDHTCRLSSKQLKSLEATLAGAFRREEMAETYIKQLEAEIEQLNRLVRQREEDTRSTKMMLKFREDKIQRMESLLEGLNPTDDYLQEENNALAEEIQLLRAKVDKNPEVTRFAHENIRLLEQIRRFQDFYEEGEREMLLAEISELRKQLSLSLDGSLKQQNHLDGKISSHGAINFRQENESIVHEKTIPELERCRIDLNSCLEENAKLRREINDLHVTLTEIGSPSYDERNSKFIGESNLRACSPKYLKNEHAEEVLDLQLELDILKIILKEEKTYGMEADEKAQSLNKDLQLSNENLQLIMKQYEDVRIQLQIAKSVIEALESQQLMSINEIEDLKKKLSSQELSIPSPMIFSDIGESPLQAKLKKMHDSLEMAKKLNQQYQSDLALQEANEGEMDEIRRQVEAETAEVIVCLQEELSTLQQEVQGSSSREAEAREALALAQVEMKTMEDRLYLIDQHNKKLADVLTEKEEQLQKNTKDCKALTNEIESVLSSGHEALEDAADQVNVISSSFPENSSYFSQQFVRMRKYITEKELTIEELNKNLEDALNRRNDMEGMLRSLRGAALVMTEAHEQECSERDREILHLTSELHNKTSALAKLEKNIKLGKDEIKKTSNCAAVAFVVVNRLSELNSSYRDTVNCMELELQELTKRRSQALSISEVEKHIEALKVEIPVLEDEDSSQAQQNSEKQEDGLAAKLKLEDENDEILITSEKLAELKSGISKVRLFMNENGKQIQCPENSTLGGASLDSDNIYDFQAGIPQHVGIEHAVQSFDNSEKFKFTSCCHVATTSHQPDSEKKKNAYERNFIDEEGKNATIILLKKEIESALESLKQVQAEMAKLQVEKEEALINEKHGQQRIKHLMNQVKELQTAISRFEEEIVPKVDALENKTQLAQNVLQCSGRSWACQKQLLEAELCDAKVFVYQKTTEASCILAKFEEAQDTMKDADIMVNELMIANEALKLNIKDMKRKELTLSSERVILQNEVDSLLSAKDLKDIQCEKLVNQFEADRREMVAELSELENTVAEVLTSHTAECTLIYHEILQLKAYHNSKKNSELVGSWLEDIWSDIIAKDCAVSVLHLCHFGVLLETVNGLNAENGLLHHGLCESNALISELKEHNSNSRKELEMFRSLERKLLTDINRSFSRISKKEQETGDLTMKLTRFDKKISDLQIHEELMLQRSNQIGSELAALVKEFGLSNIDVVMSPLEQEKSTKDREKYRGESQEENFIMEQYSKEFELLILSSELRQMNVLNAANSKTQKEDSELLSNLKENWVICSVDAAISEIILLDMECGFSALEKLTDEAETENQDLLLELGKKKSAIAQLGILKEGQEKEIESLRQVACSAKDLRNELGLMKESKAWLSSRVQQLESNIDELLEEMEMKESALRSELFRKDEIIKGLQFDLSLLQESSSIDMDKNDEIERLVASLRTLENEMEVKSFKLDEAVAENQILEDQFQEKIKIITTLELGIAKEQGMGESLTRQNLELVAEIENLLKANKLMKDELEEMRELRVTLEMQLAKMDDSLGELSTSIGLLKCNLVDVTEEKEELCRRILTLDKELKIAQALAEEKEAIAVEAQEIAEIKKEQAENKDEEVKLLEQSVEELEYTVNVLENKVEIIKGEAERQRLQREELELELHGVEQQLQDLKNLDADLKRQLNEKEKDMGEALERIQFFESEISAKNVEINQCKAHMSELFLHAEAQASESKQKFKALEAMAEQVKEVSATHGSNSSHKLEKNPSKSRGSSSPFKCIGGLVQQIKSERDEEISVERHRIQELENLAASRQKEIFMLNARLAAAESMTHDVIRDLLGLKLDMNSYASLLDKQQVNLLKGQLHNTDAPVKEQEIIKLKQQLSKFIEERKGWLEEIDRRQSEMVAAQVALEKLRQQERMLSAENDMLKGANVNNKKRVIELEDEVKKLSGQQNLHQRIHHHAKIKARDEENNALRRQNEELGTKLRKAEGLLVQVRAELTRFQESNGICPYNFDEEQRLGNKLKEVEDEKLQLAQKLLSLCTSILKVAGISTPKSEISLSVAKSALDHLTNKIDSLEREVEDEKLKNKVANERIKLSEFMPRSSPISSRVDENCKTPTKVSRTSFLSPLDR